MELRREFFLSVGTLVGFNILIAFGAIALFTRMSPAIEEILRENVASNEAAEEMLAVLIEPPAVPDRAQRLELAVRRARENITVAEEGPVLDRIEQFAPAALEGDAATIRGFVAEVRRLVRINRRAMTEADERAQALGATGAWSAAFVAVVSFVLSVALIVRLERRVVDPLVELAVVLDAARAGDPHRRCARLAGPIEVRRALASVNSLLDHLSTPTPDEREEERRVDVERVALVHLLEEHDGAVVLVDGEGEVLAANRLGLLVLGGENGESLKAWTRGLADRRDDAGDGSENGHEATALRGGVGWICRIDADGLQDMDEAPRHG